MTPLIDFTFDFRINYYVRYMAVLKFAKFLRKLTEIENVEKCQ